MSDDLISRRSILDKINEWSSKLNCENSKQFTLAEFEHMLANEPTAYDVGEVIKGIKELPTHTFETYSQGYPMDEDFIDPCDAIKIVKSGGVAND